MTYGTPIILYIFELNLIRMKFVSDYLSMHKLCKLMKVNFINRLLTLKSNLDNYKTLYLN